MRTRSLFGCLLAVVLVAMALLLPAQGKEIKDQLYRGIPPGFDFPAKEQTLLKYRDDQNVPAMRRHAWMVWAGLTHQASPEGVADFETWYSVSRAYDGGAARATPRTIREEFATPRQFFHALDAPGESRLAQILFNQETFSYIRDRKMYLSATVAELNKKFDRRQTPGYLRTVPAFPRTAVMIKTVWWPVRGEGLSPVPVWDNDPANPISSGIGNPKDTRGNGPETWKRVVAVVPPGTAMPPGERATMNYKGVMRVDAHAVPLSDFYHFKITPEILKAIDKAQVDEFGDVQVGDYAVLVGMHVATREITEWVWATFWWHDKPDQGPFAQDRPDALKSPWRHYLMNTTLSMNTPLEPDNTPKIVFNPYIEGKFANGPLSNCMTCHNRSTSPSLGEEFCGALPITRGSGDYPPQDPRRSTRTHLSFLWSLLLRPKPLAPCAAGSG